MQVKLDTKPLSAPVLQLGTKSRKRGKPFFLPDAGVLVHRVRQIHDHYDGKVRKHSSVLYWCGNVSNHGTFLDRPPKDRLLCERCEMIVKDRGLPSSSKLAGRHVHVGRLRPIQVCCTDQQERN